MQYLLPHLLEQTNRLVRDMLNDTLAAEELQTDQWAILSHLSDGRGHAMGELAEAVAINPSKLTKCVDKLVSKGLVQRSVDHHDQRKVVALITVRGMAIVERVTPEIAKLETLLINRLGRSDHKQLKQLLTQMLMTEDRPHRPS